jgi:hypothetical protein
MILRKSDFDQHTNLWRSGFFALAEEYLRRFQFCAFMPDDEAFAGTHTSIEGRQLEGKQGFREPA